MELIIQDTLHESESGENRVSGKQRSSNSMHVLNVSIGAKQASGSTAAADNPNRIVATTRAQRFVNTVDSAMIRTSLYFSVSWDRNRAFSKGNSALFGSW